MNPDCVSFRAELELALAGPSEPLARLASHAHARGCSSCRTELAREQRLERLLERLPLPHVPPGLPQRVRTALARDDSPSGAPTHAGALADAELDALLARMPAPRAPAGLAGRVLSATEDARGRLRSRTRPRRGLLLVAAVLLAALALWISLWRGPTERRIELARDSGIELDALLESDEELLTYAVERWELLHDEDLDVWLASLEPLDELLMEMADDATWLHEPESAAASEGD